MQRYFIHNSQMHDGIIEMDEVMHKHMAKVMRKKPGEQVICTDESGRFHLSTIADLEKGILIDEKIIDENNELDVKVTLIYGLPKGDKFEFVLQKATELGVSRVVPLRCERSLVKMDEQRFAKKVQRFHRILQEAAEQSHRNVVPEIVAPIKVAQMKDYRSQINIVAYEESAKQGETSALAQAMRELRESITIVVGPEGGFSDVEIQKMKDAGFTSVGLGPRIMRSETAPLYLLSVIGYERELAHGKDTGED